MMRLRCGKNSFCGSMPGAYSETNTPRGRSRRELVVLARKNRVETAAEHGDRSAERLHRAAMARAVDADGEPARDRQAALLK